MNEFDGRKTTILKISFDEITWEKRVLYHRVSAKLQHLQIFRFCG